MGPHGELPLFLLTSHTKSYNFRDSFPFAPGQSNQQNLFIGGRKINLKFDPILINTFQADTVYIQFSQIGNNTDLVKWLSS